MWLQTDDQAMVSLAGERAVDWHRLCLTDLLPIVDLQPQIIKNKQHMFRKDTRKTIFSEIPKWKSKVFFLKDSLKKLCN